MRLLNKIAENDVTCEMLHRFSALQFVNIFTEVSKIVLPLPSLTIFHEFCKYYSNIILHKIVILKGWNWKKSNEFYYENKYVVCLSFYTVDTDEGKEP